MAGEWPHKTGQGHGSDRASLERRDEARLGRENQVRKHQPEFTLSGGNGKRKGTDTARLFTWKVDYHHKSNHRWLNIQSWTM